MHKDRTLYVIPLIIACIAFVIGFGFLVDAGSASAGSDALGDIILDGSIEGNAVLDDYFVIESSTGTTTDYYGWSSSDPSATSTDGVIYSYSVGDLLLKGKFTTNSRDYTYSAFNAMGFRAGTVANGYIIDANGQKVDVTYTFTQVASAGISAYLSPASGSPTYIDAYHVSESLDPEHYFHRSSGQLNWWARTALRDADGNDIGIRALVLYNPNGIIQFSYSGYTTWIYSTVEIETSQHLYCLAVEESEKYYFWLFREGRGSSLILEGRTSSGVPAVTITNGGRYYTDNYFVALDMYDIFGVSYKYDIQMSAFDSSSNVVKQTFTFGEIGSSSGGGGSSILPPTIIEIPETVHGIISSPGELPNLNLPFDFSAPILTLDLTSGFNTAFNSTWLGVNDAYMATKDGIDNFVSSFAPKLDGVFSDIVYTITTYVDSFRVACEEMRDTYAVPFFNLMVRISSLVPSPVWIVFDIWLIYSAVRLIVWVFTCPLSDVIRRSF